MYRHAFHPRPFVSHPRTPFRAHVVLLVVALHMAALSMLVPRVSDRSRFTALDIQFSSASDVDSARLATAGRAPFLAADVDKVAVASRTNPKPLYPPELAERLQEASFVVYFVVDTLGRIDAKTIEVPPSVEPEFALAAREAIAHWRYEPAERQGRRVRQFVRQPIRFRITHRE